MRYAICLLLALSAVAQTALPIDDAAKANNFRTVTADLDTGGGLFLYLATDRLIADARERFRTFVDVHRQGARRPQVVEDIDEFETITNRVLEDWGVPELAGVGLSSIALTETLERTRLAIYHQPGQSEGLLWYVFGSEAAPLDGVKLLPETTAAAYYTRIELPLMWAWLNDLYANVAPDNERQRWERQLAWWRDQGVDWHRLIEGVDGEFALAITLDPEQPLMIRPPQDGREGVSIPSPGFLAVIRTRDARFLELFDAQSTQRKWPVTVEDSESLRLRVGPLLPLPVPLQPCVAQAGDYFYVASRPQLIEASLAVRDGEAAGLAANEEFLALASDLPGSGNQVLWMNRAFSETMVQALHLAARNRRDPNAVLRLVEPSRPTASLTVVQRNGRGLLVTTHTNGDARWAAMQLGLVPAAIGGFIARPIARNARVREREVKSAGNLKQLGLAALMWAEDHDGQFPAPDGAQGLRQLSDANYIKARTFRRRGGRNADAEVAEPTVDYVYLGAGLRADMDPASAIPVAFEKLDGNARIPVLFLDSHVETIAGNYRNCREVVDYLARRGNLPDDLRKRLLEKASQMDQILGYPRE